MRLRKFWGWGYDDELLSSEEENNIDQRIAKTFQLDHVERIEIPKISDIDINKPLFSTPSSLKKILSDDKLERLNHAYGKSFPDSARSILGDFSSPPDYVAFPETQN